MRDSDRPAQPDRLSGEPTRPPEEPSDLDVLIVRALLGVVAVGGLLPIAWTILWQPMNLGFEDWDYFFQGYEAVKISIVHYGQFPWWNIWNCGGVPPGRYTVSMSQDTGPWAETITGELPITIQDRPRGK